MPVLAPIAILPDGMRADVHVKDAPDCRRHRYADQSLCVWFDSDSADHKSTSTDGLALLAADLARH